MTAVAVRGPVRADIGLAPLVQEHLLQASYRFFF